ncbi:MAG: Flp family type IVb pilin [Hyphomonadaceae bacterium]|nr:Flp family type IVb pilin [Hyphomonadaceae bacterium]
MMVTFLRDERGATSIEYALVASLIGMVIIAAVTSVGDRLIPIFEAISAGFN